MNLKHISLAIVTILLLTNCSNDDDTQSISEPATKEAPVPFQNEIKRFIYSAMNFAYLYRDEVPDFSPDRFRTQQQFNAFINSPETPEAFFERLTPSKDRFSYIIDDFISKEASSRGVRISNGLKFRLHRIGESNNLYLIVTDVLPNSPAELAGLKRGFLINKIDGKQLNLDNYGKLFDDPSFTLGQAELSENRTLISTNNSFQLTKIELTENPIRISKVIEYEGRKIGYLFYNGFIFSFEEQLNDEFSKFKTAGVSDFILDLRYNGGGSVFTANALTGMITGNLTGQVFAKEQWNSRLQARFENENPEALTQTFTDTTAMETQLNSIGMSKLYVITSKRQTASARELVINSLRPYIDVVVIGDPKGTVGKSQASTTLYDSENLGREDANPNHTYAIQPLIFKTVNRNDVGVPNEGITPDIFKTEDLFVLGELGNPEEILLKTALNRITGNSEPSAKIIINNPLGKYLGNDAQNDPTYQRMYTSKKNINSFF